MSDGNKGVANVDRIITLINIIPDGQPGLTVKELHNKLIEMGYDTKIRTLYRDLDKIKKIQSDKELISSSGGRKETTYYFEDKKNSVNVLIVPKGLASKLDKLGLGEGRVVSAGKQGSLRHTTPAKGSQNTPAKKAEKPKPVEPEKQSFRIELSEKIRDLVINEVNDYCDSHVKEEYSGRQFILFDAEVDSEIIRWILSFGHQVVVHEPFVLREMIGKEINRMGKNYSAGFDGLGDD